MSANEGSKETAICKKWFFIVFSELQFYIDVAFYLRTLDGRLNNPKKIFNGAVGENLLRLAGNGYADKIFMPSGACSMSQRLKSTCPFPKENNGTGSNRPNPRVISNTLIRQVSTDISSFFLQKTYSLWFYKLYILDLLLTNRRK